MDSYTVRNPVPDVRGILRAMNGLEEGWNKPNDRGNGEANCWVGLVERAAEGGGSQRQVGCLSHTNRK